MQLILENFDIAGMASVTQKGSCLFSHTEIAQGKKSWEILRRL